MDVKKIYAKKDSGGYVFKNSVAEEGQITGSGEKMKGSTKAVTSERDNSEEEDDDEYDNDNDEEGEDEFDSGSDVSIDVLSYVQEDISPSNCWTVLKHVNAGRKVRKAY